MKNTYVLFFVILFAQMNSQNNALDLDGANDKIDIANNGSLNFSITDKFSIEAWFKTTATGYRILVSNRIDTPPYTGYEFMLSSGAIDFSIISTTSGSMKAVTTANTFNDGNWHHAAAVYHGNPNGNTVDLYVDGILQSKTVPLNTLSGTITNTNLITIGARQGVTAYNFTGPIDEVRIWNKVLCAQEIVAKKDCHLSGNEYGLKAYYNFNQGIASANNTGITSLPDLSPSANTGTLTFFALNGGSSNWINGATTVTGTCTPYYGSLAVTGNTVLCSPQTFSTILTATGATSYSWVAGPTTASISVSPTITTIYTVTATDANTCTVYKTVSVSVNTAPVFTLSSTHNTLCSGNSATLSATGAPTYTWSNASAGSSIIVNPGTNTTYSVSSTSSAGCTYTSQITITVSASPNITINTPSTTICNGQNINLNAGGASTYSWSNGFTTGGINISPTVSTTYSVIGTNTVTGCSNTSAVLITVIDCTSLKELNTGYSVNLFPNPANDKLYISSDLIIDHVEIYDLVGKLISNKEIINGYLSIGDLNKGIYVLQVRSGEPKNMFKFIKE